MRRDQDEPDNSLPAQIAQALTERIITGELLPGQPVRQDAVGKEFGVSHVPVREAFRRLELRGLIVSQPRRGVCVAPLDEAALVEITRMRAALECLALRYAMGTVSSQELDDAMGWINAGGQAQDIQTWERCNRKFHSTLYLPCAMPRLLAEIAMLHDARLRYMYALAADIDWDPKSQVEHLALLDLIKEQDMARACAFLESHIIEAGDQLLAALKSNKKNRVM